MTSREHTNSGLVPALFMIGGTLLTFGASAAGATPSAAVANASPAPSSSALAFTGLPSVSTTDSAAAPTSPAAASASTGLPTEMPSLCVEHIPAGKARPTVKESFPSKGLSGHHVTLKLEIEHGAGETVLPGALQLQTKSDAAKQIEAAGFVFPDGKGPAHPRVHRQDTPNGAKTTVEFPLLALPKKPGRTDLVLPSLPIAMSRASGEVITLCTQPHTISVEDPTANVPNAKPKPNPKPLRQREFWLAMRNATYGGIAALLMAGMGYLVARWWRRRPRPLTPPPPKRPPWEVALEAFFDIRQARLIEQGRLADHFDRVSGALRQYLGDRFGFDALESTTQEIVGHLQQTPEAAAFASEVEMSLLDVDLVKFAKMAPTEAQCHSLLEQSEQLVRRSIPVVAVAPVAEVVTGGNP
jgi:hypothetical protein